MMIDFGNGNPIPAGGLSIDAGTGNDMLRVLSARDTSTGMATSRSSLASTAS
jgi:hypothetical protein